MSNAKGVSAEFMLAEYERISSLRSGEITSTEQRFNFFLTIATAAIGAIVVLSQVANLSFQVYSTVMQGLLSILLLFGLTNQNRQNVRSLQIRFYDQQIAKIQDYFAESDTEVVAYLDWQRGLMKRSQPKSRLAKVFLARFRGSLTDLITLSNSALCGGIALVTLSANGNSPQTVTIWTLITFIVAMLILYTYNGFMRKVLPLAV
jgi:hypothetical protein